MLLFYRELTDNLPVVGTAADKRTGVSIILKALALYFIRISKDKTR